MRFENQQFEGGEIALDYNEFVNCTFKHCVLSYHGGNFSFQGQITIDHVQFTVSEHAARTLEFLKALKTVMPQVYEQLIDQAGQPTAPASGRMN